MKKILTLAAAALVSLGLWAATETHPSSASKDAAVVGVSYTIPGTYIAGTGGTMAGDMTTKGVKFRLNQAVGETANAFEFKVNVGCKITKLEFCGHVNDGSKTAKVKQVIVDGSALDVTEVSLPTKSSSVSFSYDFEATSNIVFVFEGEGTQANLEYKVTYEITAETHKITYKANYGEVADVVDAAALVIKGNQFRYPENQYFVGWNTKADGTGEAVEIGGALTQDTILFAQWKSFTACARMAIDSGLVDPAKDVEVALKEGSTGGKMFFAGAKEDNYEESFIYKKGGGLQLSKGAADSLRVELDNALYVGSVLQLELIAASDGQPGLSLVSAGKSKSVPLLYDVNVTEKDTICVYYTVVADDGFAGSSYLCIQRGGNTVILNALSIELCTKSKDASINWLKINGAAVAAEENVYAYTVAAEENLAEVEVTFELAEGATADQASGFKVAVPTSSEDPATEVKLTVTAEDETTKVEYTIKVSRAAAGAPKSNDATIKEVKINNEVVAEAEGVFAYEVPAEIDLAEVSVAFVLNEAHATADKENPFKLAVPATSEAPATEAVIKVTAEDGTTTKEYKVVITRAVAKSNDANIKSLKVNDEAVEEDTGTFAYEVEFDSKLAEVEVSFVLNDPKATADRENPFKVAVPTSPEMGATQAVIKVTAEDGVTTKEYKVVITRGEEKKEGIDNTAAEVKIVKTIENGQIVIIKNGVKYNAQGAVVK